MAVIPARIGSRRIPNKNLKPFGSRPLITHTIDAATDSGVFDRVLVSTESDEIASVARGSGAEVPFRRPAKLADDHTTSAEVTCHALRQLDNCRAVAQLLPTSPLLTASHVHASAHRYWSEPDRSLISVTSIVGVNVWWAARIVDDRLDFLFPSEQTARSQDQPSLVAPTGAIWWADVQQLLATRTFYDLNPRPFEIPFPHGIDIDNPEDWCLAEAMRTYLDDA